LPLVCSKLKETAEKYTGSSLGQRETDNINRMITVTDNQVLVENYLSSAETALTTTLK
jgi:hypothetical protein